MGQGGMTLIEIMVAVSILSVIMLGIMTMTKNMTKTAKDTEKRGDIDQIMTMITQALQDKTTCSATVLGVASVTDPVTTPNVVPIHGIMRVNAAGEVELDSRMRAVSLATAVATGSNRTIINGMALRQVEAPSAATKYELVVTFVKNPAAANGQAMSQANTMQNIVVKKIPLNLDVCTRTYAYGQGGSTPNCGAGIAVGMPVAVISANGSNPSNFLVQACQVCGAGNYGRAQGCM
jgi:prepilin-type N-terminal cleavage/methylation domain-containing protein